MDQPITPAPARPDDPDYMLSLARGLSIIRSFGSRGAGHSRLSIAEAAQLTGMSRAAARRCLHTLEILGYVARVNGQFELAPRVLALGYAYVGSAPLATMAQPVLENVAERVNESCSLAMIDGDEIVYVARAARRRVISIGLSVGSRLPVYCTSMGRAILAFASQAQQTAYLSRVELVRHTKFTIVDRAALRAELGRVRAAGYALADQELELGLRSLAVPVRGHDGGVIAAVNVGVHAVRVKRETMTRTYLPLLQNAAQEIALAIGHVLR
jgi:IclR family pca regulon transcriptional regulator